MKSKFLAQAIDFNKLKEAFPAGSLPRTAEKIADLINPLLKYVYVLAGLVLFIYLIIGGFGLLTSAGNPKAVESAKGKITNAIIGFIIIFISYWIIQILEIVFGIEVLGI